MDAEEDPVWRRVDDELQLRASKNQTPDSWPELGRAMGLGQDKRALPVNWRLRKKLPPAWYKKTAEALGWTTDQLLNGIDAAQAKSSTDELDQPQIHKPRTSLSRDEFLAICANLSTPDWQLTARLMVAAGILPGVVEVMKKWDLKEAGSGKPEVRPMTVEGMADEQARRKPL